MPWARLIHALLITMTLVVAPWFASGHATPAPDQADRPSCCGEGCCCCPVDELPLACPCCPAPVAPKPTNPTAPLVSIASVNAAVRIARPRTPSQSTPRDFRRELNARLEAQHRARVARQAWRTPSDNVRLSTCVHQT